LISLAADNFVYIRNERDGSERLFDERADPDELNDKSKEESIRPVLDDFRHQLERFREKLAPSPR
jgi:hypothetical protein